MAGREPEPTGGGAPGFDPAPTTVPVTREPSTSGTVGTTCSAGLGHQDAKGTGENLSSLPALVRFTSKGTRVQEAHVSSHRATSSAPTALESTRGLSQGRT